VIFGIVTDALPKFLNFCRAQGTQNSFIEIRRSLKNSIGTFVVNISSNKKKIQEI
jgi:hypothetical protein